MMEPPHRFTNDSGNPPLPDHAVASEQIKDGDGVALAQDTETGRDVWTRRLVLFLRLMAVLFMVKGLYQWAEITGFIAGPDYDFELQTRAWQTATVYFAVIDLVAAVGLWLATPWGAVVWLTTVVSLAVIDIVFPDVYSLRGWTVIFALLLLVAYLALAWMAARERPP
jgi:hypothetical protein